ncbi:MAG TPA: hypothetical protein DCE42_00765 [Myxococcales bacterium]|nr:hypothetical protein [Myxococcales bacterium]
MGSGAVSLIASLSAFVSGRGSVPVSFFSSGRGSCFGSGLGSGPSSTTFSSGTITSSGADSVFAIGYPSPSSKQKLFFRLLT